jgi:hypothetical protein
MRWLGSALLAAALTAPLAAIGDVSLRCDGGIVSIGDSKLDLLGKCGVPSLQEASQEDRASFQRTRDDQLLSGRRVTLTIERWTYDFGPRRFIQVVTLDTGKVVSIEQGSYGYGVAPPQPALGTIPRARCEHLGLREGLTTYDVLARCGPPAVRDGRLVKLFDAGDGTTVTRTVTVEVWSYDFGPRVLVRRLEFEDGRLARVETGGYGYSESPPG